MGEVYRARDTKLKHAVRDLLRNQPSRRKNVVS
jgi:hypothetical protein